MRVAPIDNCLGCPYFRQMKINNTMAWGCTDKKFKKPHGDERFNKDGSYPVGAHIRVSDSCGLTEVDPKKSRYGK